jgi:PAS domain S-box-containing protein
MMRQSERGANHWRHASGALVSSIGLISALVHSYHFVTESPETFSAVVSGIVVPLFVSFALLGAGGWLAKSDYAGEYALRIAGWSLVGAVILTFSAISMTQYQKAVGSVLDGGSVILADSVTGGTAIGFVFGIYAIRIKRQTVQLDQYRRKLKRERDQFVSLFNNLPDPAMQYEHAGNGPVISLVNPAFEETFGTDAASINGTPVSDVIVPHDSEEEAIDLRSALRSGRVLQREIRQNTPNGLRDFQLIVIPTRIAATESTGHIIATDVTDRKQYVRRLEVLNRVLRHDLRNEANIIVGYAGMLQDENCESRKAERIREKAYELVELGNKARHIGHALDHDTETDGPIDLTEVLHRCIDRAQNTYPDADIQTELREDIQVCANDQIDSVFDNVIQNAIEHNDSDTPLVSITVTTDDPEFVTIEISDDGPGIPDRERKVLEQESETQLQHSLGLGLSLVNWIVVDSGGKITISDNNPKGSVVTIALPRPDSYRAYNQ